MKKILYIGNKLAGHGRTPTTIDTLGLLLDFEGFELRYASDQLNTLSRMADMLSKTFRWRSWTDVVLIDTYSTRNFWYAILVARLCRILNIKYLPILHGGNLPERLHRNPKVFDRFLKQAWKVVSPSAYLHQAFAKAGYQNIHIIPNSIDLTQYDFTARAELRPKLLWVRSFAEIYNPQMAIQVLAALSKKYPDASLTMVGPEKDGSLQTCKALAGQLGVAVHFPGLLDKEDWIQLSTQHDIFINTTSFDNLPVSVIEAMALGLSVVSTEVGGIPYLIEDKTNGLLVVEGDVAGMTDAIEKLVENKVDHKRLCSNALKDARKFGWNRIRSQWAAVLEV